MIDRLYQFNEEDPPSPMEEPPERSQVQARDLHNEPADFPSGNESAAQPVRLRLLRKRKNPSKARLFRTRFYPEVSQKEWDDWQWQIAHRITSLEALGRMIHLSDGEREVFSARGNGVPLSITDETNAAKPGADQPVCGDSSVWMKSSP